MSGFSCFGFWKEVNEYRIFADLTRILLAFGGSSNCNGDLICWGPDIQGAVNFMERSWRIRIWVV